MPQKIYLQNYAQVYLGHKLLNTKDGHSQQMLIWFS